MVEDNKSRLPTTLLLLLSLLQVILSFPSLVLLKFMGSLLTLILGYYYNDIRIVY